MLYFAIVLGVIAILLGIVGLRNASRMVMRVAAVFAIVFIVLFILSRVSES